MTPLFSFATPVLAMSYLVKFPSSVEATGFMPQDLIDVCVGTITIKLYMKITPTMPVFGCAHTFQVNKSALDHLQSDLRLILTHLATS
jgi:hypothetical protein